MFTRSRTHTANTPNSVVYKGATYEKVAIQSDLQSEDSLAKRVLANAWDEKKALDLIYSYFMASIKADDLAVDSFLDNAAFILRRNIKEAIVESIKHF